MKRAVFSVAPIGLTVLLVNSAFGFWVTGITRPGYFTKTHQQITLDALEAFSFSACPTSQIVDYVAGVDFAENTKTGQPNELYEGVHHFDRKPGQTHSKAFLEGRAYLQAMKQGSLRAFQRDDKVTGMQLLGLALHNIQDFVAHSNLVDELDAGQQDAAITALLTGIGNMPDSLRLMYYDPQNPHKHDSQDPLDSKGGYTHEDHNNDDPGRAFSNHFPASIKAREVSESLISDIASKFGTSFCNDKPGKPITPGTSADPNDKIGSQGAGQLQYLAAEAPLRYGIFYENKPTATLPAQEVIISDQLDLTTVDLSTFSLGLISLPGIQVAPPPGLRQFVSSVDLRPATNLMVKIDARLEPTSGLLTWRLTSIDPATGMPPLNPAIGFLPPNANPPEDIAKWHTGRLVY